MQAIRYEAVQGQILENSTMVSIQKLFIDKEKITRVNLLGTKALTCSWKVLPYGFKEDQGQMISYLHRCYFESPVIESVHST